MDNMLRAEWSPGQISGKCHRLCSAFSSGQTTTPHRAHKTSTSGSAQSKAATCAGRWMPLSIMYYPAAKMATWPSAQEERRQEANRDRPRRNQQSIHFLLQGEAPQNTGRRPAPNLLTSEAEWRMEMDMGRQELRRKKKPNNGLLCSKNGFSLEI